MPIYLCAGSGNGKTHLAKAIEQELSRRHPEKKIWFTNAELFVAEVIQDVVYKTKRVEEKGNLANVLVVEDIHFLADKEATQKTFVNVIRSACVAGKTVILTCGCYAPWEVQMLHNLKKQLGEGTNVVIDSPDYDTRYKIVEGIVSERFSHLDIPEEVKCYIAETIGDNGKKLEGAVTRIAAYIDLAGEEQVYRYKEILKDMEDV